MARGDPDPQRRRSAGEPQRRFQVHRLAVDPGVDRCRGIYLQPRRAPCPARKRAGCRLGRRGRRCRAGRCRAPGGCREPAGGQAHRGCSIRARWRDDGARGRGRRPGPAQAPLRSGPSPQPRPCRQQGSSRFATSSRRSRSRGREAARRCPRRSCRRSPEQHVAQDVVPAAVQEHGGNAAHSARLWPRQALSAVHGDNEAWYTAEFMFGSSDKMNTAKLATIRKMLTTGNRRAGRPSDNGSISRPPFP